MIFVRDQFDAYRIVERHARADFPDHTLVKGFFGIPIVERCIRDVHSPQRQALLNFGYERLGRCSAPSDSPSSLTPQLQNVFRRALHDKIGTHVLLKQPKVALSSVVGKQKLKDATSPAPTPTMAKSPPEPVEEDPPCPAGCPTAVTFHEHGKKWGWDDHTNSAVPWMSVQSGKSDTVTAKSKVAAEGAKMCNVTYASSDPAIADVEPKSGSADNQTLTIEGKKKGEVTITATCGGAEIGKFKVASYDLVTKTLAVRLVHEENYKSTDVSDAVIKAYLKKVFDQGVVTFTVTRLPVKTVKFDLNKNKKIDVDSWMSAEMIKIRDACKDDIYDHNIFLVNKSSDNSAGYMGFNNRYGFVHPDTGTARKTVAHELGHGAFGLNHTDKGSSKDPDNIMYSDYSDKKWKLRKNQWDDMH